MSSRGRRCFLFDRSLWMLLEFAVGVDNSEPSWSRAEVLIGLTSLDRTDKVDTEKLVRLVSWPLKTLRNVGGDPLVLLSCVMWQLLLVVRLGFPFRFNINIFLKLYDYWWSKPLPSAAIHADYAKPPINPSPNAYFSCTCRTIFFRPYVGSTFTTRKRYGLCGWYEACSLVPH